MPLKTLFLNPPSFENFDGGAGSRWPATREIESYWYPVWLAYPAGMLEGARLIDAPSHHISAEETIRAAKEVADLEYQVAQSNLESLKVRLDAGSIAWHDVQDAREQVNERYNSLQDANFELERARITLLRATGELEAWVGAGK